MQAGWKLNTGCVKLKPFDSRGGYRKSSASAGDFLFTVDDARDCRGGGAVPERSEEWSGSGTTESP